MVRMISVMTITARILIDNNSKQITTVVEYNLTHVYEPNLTLPHQFNIFLKQYIHLSKLLLIYNSNRQSVTSFEPLRSRP